MAVKFFLLRQIRSSVLMFHQKSYCLPTSFSFAARMTPALSSICTCSIGDLIGIVFDSYRDFRTSYEFIVNARHVRPAQATRNRVSAIRSGKECERACNSRQPIPKRNTVEGRCRFRRQDSPARLYTRCDNKSRFRTLQKIATRFFPHHPKLDIFLKKFYLCSEIFYRYLYVLQ